MKARLMRVKRSATIAGLLLLVAAPGYAQTGYPPGPGTTQPSAVDSTYDLGTPAMGETITRELCGFTPNSTVPITVNGSFVTNKTASASGCVLIELKVVSGSTIEVGDQITVSVECGSNELTAAGSQADGNAVNQTLRFDVACGTRAQTNSTASTGANIARGSIAGAAVVGTGVLLLLGSRRRKTHET
jgi:hypothetical protein